MIHNERFPTLKQALTYRKLINNIDNPSRLTLNLTIKVAEWASDANSGGFHDPWKNLIAKCSISFTHPNKKQKIRGKKSPSLLEQIINHTPMFRAVEQSAPLTGERSPFIIASFLTYRIEFDIGFWKALWGVILRL
ncbi:hypothetical protein NPIL_337861 [Nephila pilipes]|uniref:Uncharacterized protein n=1 Tax=Nephila pilipes TaxID=299642 RepID=A0A8X6U9E2_NEPPI|nr:hypothetical protein NPIL_337861 [Nephila pilipes]